MAEYNKHLYMVVFPINGKGQVEQAAEMIFKGGVAVCTGPFHVGGSRTDRAFEALAANGGAQPLEGVPIGEQILGGKGQTVPKGGGFCGLQVGPGDEGQVVIGGDFFGERDQEGLKFRQEEIAGGA